MPTYFTLCLYHLLLSLNPTVNICIFHIIIPMHSFIPTKSGLNDRSSSQYSQHCIQQCIHIILPDPYYNQRLSVSLYLLIPCWRRLRARSVSPCDPFGRAAAGCLIFVFLILSLSLHTYLNTAFILLISMSQRRTFSGSNFYHICILNFLGVGPT